MVVDDKTILITGCGSFAKAFANQILLHHKPKKIIFLSRDEFFQVLAREEVADPKGLTRWFIGDVRDYTRLLKALKGVDIVIHTAALKRIEVNEYNPFEAIMTNIFGTQNVIDACIERGVEQAVLLSTDKAVEPINLYGATKLCAEKIWIDANYFKPVFSVVRYGNVMGSRGSVLPKFQELAQAKKEFPVHDIRMTRFWVSLEDAVKMVLEVKEYAKIYILKARSFRIVDLAKALYARAKIKETGIEPGEKVHEVLIGMGEGVTDEGWYYVVHQDRIFLDGDKPVVKGPKVLSSEFNTMSIKEIRELL